MGGLVKRLAGVLEPSWGRLGASWDVWVPSGSVLKASWGILGCLDFLGAVQACPGGVTRGRVRRLVLVCTSVLIDSKSNPYAVGYFCLLGWALEMDIQSKSSPYAVDYFRRYPFQK